MDPSTRLTLPIEQDFYAFHPPNINAADRRLEIELSDQVYSLLYFAMARHPDQGNLPSLQVAMRCRDGLIQRMWLDDLVSKNVERVQSTLSLLYEKTLDTAAQKHQKMASLWCCSCGGTNFFTVSCEDECGITLCYDCARLLLGFPVEPTSNVGQDGARMMFKMKHDHHRCKMPRPMQAFVPLPTLLIGLVATEDEDMTEYLQKELAFRSLGPRGFGTTVLSHRVSNLQQIRKAIKSVRGDITQGLHCSQAVVLWTGHHDPVEQLLLGENASSDTTLTLGWRSLGSELRVLFQDLRAVVQEPNHVSMVFDSCQVAPKLCKQFASAAGLEQGVPHAVFAFGHPVPWYSFKKVFVDAAKLYCNQEVASHLGCTEMPGRLSLQQAFCGALSAFDKNDLRMYVVHMKGTEVRYDFLRPFIPSPKQLLHCFKAEGLGTLGIDPPKLPILGSGGSGAQPSPHTAAAVSPHTAAASAARCDSFEPSSFLPSVHLLTGTANGQCSPDAATAARQQQSSSNRNSRKRAHRLSRGARQEKARKKLHATPSVFAEAAQATR